MRIVMLLLFTICAALAADLPPAAKSAVEAYDAKVAKLKADHEKAVQKESDALAATLAKAQEAETKKGNLEGALAIKAKIDTLEKKQDSITPILASLPQMTEEEWKKLPGDIYTITANDPAVTRLTLRQGEKAVMLPCPTDKWEVETGETIGYEGLKTKPKWNGVDANAYEICWSVPDGEKKNKMVIENVAGRITLQANIIKPQPGRVGTIRVKLAKLP